MKALGYTIAGAFMFAFALLAMDFGTWTLNLSAGWFAFGGFAFFLAAALDLRGRR